MSVNSEQCGKQYFDTSGLTRHIKSVHEGVKGVCNKSNKIPALVYRLTFSILTINIFVYYTAYCKHGDPNLTWTVSLFVFSASMLVWTLYSLT